MLTSNVNRILFLIFQSILFLIQLNSANMYQNQLPKPAQRIANEPESVWVEFIQLALEAKPLNLGQGFPDFAAPSYLVESLHNATSTKDSTTVLNNQYTRSFGHPRLIKALTKYYNQFRSFNQLSEPNSQVLITVGAYEALFTSLMAFVEPGDEVIIIDPAFDAYAPIVTMAGGRNVYVPLRLEGLNDVKNSTTISSSAFRLNMREFESKITNKTKVLVLNTPNNPLGKMYSKQELQEISKLCIKYNLLVIADEVYEQMYYKPDEHLSIALEPNMWDRTITIGSAGKTFSVTGWKVGWALGPAHLIKYLQLVHQTAVYTVATPLQEAIARALESEMTLLVNQSDYWTELRGDLVRKRDRMANILANSSIQPIVPQGGYFMFANVSSLQSDYPEYKISGKSKDGLGIESDDYKFARWLSREKKLQGIPGSAFYSNENKHLATKFIRFCFIKRDQSLDQMEEIISSQFSRRNGAVGGHSISSGNSNHLVSGNGKILSKL